MSSDALRDLLSATPFVPLLLTLPSGKTIVIRHPDFAMFSETGRTLAVFLEGDRFTTVDVTLIEAVEPADLPRPAPAQRPPAEPRPPCPAPAPPCSSRENAKRTPRSPASPLG